MPMARSAPERLPRHRLAPPQPPSPQRIPSPGMGFWALPREAAGKAFGVRRSERNFLQTVRAPTAYMGSRIPITDQVSPGSIPTPRELGSTDKARDSTRADPATVSLVSVLLGSMARAITEADMELKGLTAPE